MSKILDNVWVGNIKNARSLRWLYGNGITHIVNCAKGIPNYYPDKMVYKNLNLFDSTTQSLGGKPEEAYRFISKALADGGTVLIHCHAGVSRAGSTIIYYLMRAYKIPYTRALAHSRSKRSIINPNDYFTKQLRSFSLVYTGKE